MTSISSNPVADRMQYALQAAVQAGTVNASDQNALSTALNNIDSSLQSTAAASSTTNLDPGSIKDQVNSLINGQVSNGTLTSDQGTELQQAFAQAAHKMGGGHHHHMHVSGGSSSDSNSDGSSDQTNPIDSLFADMTSAVDSLFGTTSTTATADTSTTAATSATSAATGTSASTSATSSADTLTASIDQLVSMLKQIEQKAVAGYTANGATTGNVANDALLVNATA